LIAVCCLLVLASCSSNNPSGPSNSALSRITDFEVTDYGANWVNLAWTSKGADPADFSYDARYLLASQMGGLEEITEDLWDVAHPAGGEPMPSEAGVAESLRVSGLVPESQYYMAVRTVRQSDGEMSDISNTVSVTTDAAALGCASPGLAIPDNNPAGVSDVITITRELWITDVAVGVLINHTWIGDLYVDVMSPGGTIVRLHNRTGSNTDDIFGWYETDQFGIPALTVDGPGALDDFDGHTSLGDWTLWVSDNAGLDLGTLAEWCIYVEGFEP